MCDCIDKFNEILKRRNVAVEQQSVRTVVQGVPEGVLTHRVVLQTHKVAASKRPKLPVFPTFCPFCGERYLKEGVGQ